ncbi:trypsin-like peptidase domain-containing protein [Sulfitobacter marinus]|nr:trypsin-like peptidase domain-containing protein [Sulfitobacter marinus]
MRYLLILLSLIALPLHAQTVPTSAVQMQLSFAPLVKEATPAVVNIYARQIVQSSRTPLQADPFFERFFQSPDAGRPRVQNSLGSGVILSEDGVVVSNYHVVGMATDIRIVLADRREFSARVMLSDAESDLAILKIDDVADLPFLTLRNSDDVEVGELALAIGNPFGVGQTVSSGIVSGLARSGGMNGGGQGYFIQTDAPINPGNSGGALIDMQGELIGINTSILTSSGGSNGIGFAIPANLVTAFVDQARDGATRFARPWAGLSGQAVDADMAAPLGLDRPGGIILSGLHPVSPFLAAGFRVGDVIIAVDGQDVHSPAEMIYRMSVAGLGKEAVITRLREGVQSDVLVSLIEAPEEPPRDEVVLSDRELLPGLKLARINPAVLSELNLSLEVGGVAVMDVGAFGLRVGLRRGDVILAVNGQNVRTPAQVRAAFKGKRSAELFVQRGGQRLSLRFRI